MMKSTYAKIAPQMAEKMMSTVGNISNATSRVAHILWAPVATGVTGYSIYKMATDPNSSEYKGPNIAL